MHCKAVLCRRPTVLGPQQKRLWNRKFLLYWPGSRLTMLKQQCSQRFSHQLLSCLSAGLLSKTDWPSPAAAALASVIFCNSVSLLVPSPTLSAAVTIALLFCGWLSKTDWTSCFPSLQAVRPTPLPYTYGPPQHLVRHFAHIPQRPRQGSAFFSRQLCRTDGLGLLRLALEGGPDAPNYTARAWNEIQLPTVRMR